jgi:mRNA interferase MazF
LQFLSSCKGTLKQILFMTTYRFGDIILIGFPHTDLQGVSKRPAIVLYDSGDQDVLVARVTTQEYVTEGDYKILDWRKGGLLAESYVRLGKQATIDKRFIVKQLGKLEATEIEKLKSILSRILLLEKTE